MCNKPGNMRRVYTIMQVFLLLIGAAAAVPAFVLLGALCQSMLLAAVQTDRDATLYALWAVIVGVWLTIFVVSGTLYVLVPGARTCKVWGRRSQ